MTISLRPATLDDAEAVTRLHLRCHEEAYGRHLPPEFFARRRETLPERVEGFRRAVSAGHVPTVTYDASGLIGLAAAGPAQDADAPAELELNMIYTIERVHGSGVGQLLLDAVIGRRAAYLWVLEDNPRAHAFYARNGFVPDGTRKLMDEDWYRLPIVRMVRPGEVS
ncbi:GNAT family N-acetyltransferase [Specibacter sp. RAF43]|uniref:GNAT family N-acetyltransferase n=1 Tax=Specibacter sp. RAF43 TaxID=3233057 RepID=UPI003F9D96CA